MSLLHDIRKQPHRTRMILFTLCVISSTAVVGAAWFRSFQETSFALLNPDQKVQEQYFAQLNGVSSPLKSLAGAYEDLRANIFGLFRDQSQVTPTPAVRSADDKEKAQPLPLSGSR